MGSPTTDLLVLDGRDQGRHDWELGGRERKDSFGKHFFQFLLASLRDRI